MAAYTDTPTHISPAKISHFIGLGDGDSRKILLRFNLAYKLFSGKDLLDPDGETSSQFHSCF